jgi:hypothetical protein
MEALPGEKYSSGKLLQKKKKAEDIKYRSNFIHNLTVKLLGALGTRKNEIEAIWEKNLVPDELLKDINTIFEQAFSTTDRVFEHKSKGAPPSLRTAKKLLKHIKVFEKSINEKHDLSPDCTQWATELCLDLKHYVQQINMAYGVVKSKDNVLRPQGRRTNFLAKDAFWIFVKEHQLKNGPSTYPKPQVAQKALQKMGHKVTTRTLGNWKSQIENGTFSHLVQSKNGNI